MKKIKARATDFEYTDLPKNRVEVFFDVLKNQWRKLALLGLLTFVAFFPYIITIFLRDNYLLGISYSLSKGKISQTDAYKLYCISHLIAAGISWITFYFTAFMMGGVIRIIRQLIWQEPVFFKEDFTIGSKQNFKFGAIASTFFGIALVVSKIVLFFSNNGIVQAIPMAIFIAFLVPPLLLTYMEGTIYSGSFKQLFRNASLIYIKRAPTMLLFSFILISPIFLKYIENIIVLKYILIIVILVFVLILLILIYYLFSNSIFDNFINKENYPELIRKGMSKEENN